MINRAEIHIELVPLVAAFAVALPYLLAVLGPRSGSAATPGWQGARALELHLSMVGMWAFTLVAMRRWWRVPESRGWLITGLPALSLPFVVHLVGGNEYKGLFFLLVVLSPVAGAGLARLVRDRTALGLALLLPFIPTPYLAAKAYVQETPPGILTPGDRLEVVAAGASLPADAVLWRPTPGTGYSAYGVALGRPFYLSDPYALQVMGQWTGEEARWRRGSLNLVATAAQTPHAVGAAQERLGQRPVFPMVTLADARRYPHLGPALARLGYRPHATTPHFIIYGIRQPQ